MPIESPESAYETRLSQLRQLEQLGINPFPAAPPRITHTNSSLRNHYEDLQGSQVAIAGRMVSKREHGKIIFTDIDDATASIQAILQQNRLDKFYDIFRRCFEPGDFISVIGNLEKTRRGEISVWGDQVTMLTKALRPAPLKLEDPEIHQRQRYLDTLVNLESRERFRIRTKIVRHMRDYFSDVMGCLEVDTPILDTTYGGAAARPFKTYHNALDLDMFLRISNELYLKRYTTGGYTEGVFEFSRDFRNEGMDKVHNPEFTLLELYKPFWDYNMMMDMAEDLVSTLALKLHSTTKVKYGDHVIDYAKPWKRVTVYQGIQEMLDIDPATISLSDLTTLASKHDVRAAGRGEMLLGLFEQTWEDKLIQPTFVLDYPTETSALTKRHRINPELTERFECYIAGMEVMNCYTELNDPRDQRARFENEKQKRDKGDSEAMPFDEDFILSQEYGMPQQAGIGISVDKLAMLMTNSDHIRKVIYFPTLKPIQVNQ